MNLTLDDPSTSEPSFLLCDGADPACWWDGRQTCISAPPPRFGGQRAAGRAPVFLGEGSRLPRGGVLMQVLAALRVQPALSWALWPRPVVPGGSTPACLSGDLRSCLASSQAVAGWAELFLALSFAKVVSSCPELCCETKWTVPSLRDAEGGSEERDPTHIGPLRALRGSFLSMACQPGAPAPSLDPMFLCFFPGQLDIWQVPHLSVWGRLVCGPLPGRLRVAAVRALGSCLLSQPRASDSAEQECGLF